MKKKALFQEKLDSQEKISPIFENNNLIDAIACKSRHCFVLAALLPNY